MYKVYLRWYFTNCRPTEIPTNKHINTESDKSYNFRYICSTYSGGDPRKLNDVNTISTRCPGPAKKIYKHWREWFDGLFDGMLIIGAVNVPFCGPPGRDTNVWSHSIEDGTILKTMILFQNDTKKVI